MVLKNVHFFLHLIWFVVVTAANWRNIGGQKWVRAPFKKVAREAVQKWVRYLIEEWFRHLCQNWVRDLKQKWVCDPCQKWVRRVLSSWSSSLCCLSCNGSKRMAQEPKKVDRIFAQKVIHFCIEKPVRDFDQKRVRDFVEKWVHDLVERWVHYSVKNVFHARAPPAPSAVLSFASDLTTKSQIRWRKNMRLFFSIACMWHCCVRSLFAIWQTVCRGTSSGKVVAEG